MNGPDALFVTVFGLSALALVASLSITLVTQRLTGGRVRRPFATLMLIFGVPALGLVASLAVMLLTDTGR